MTVALDYSGSSGARDFEIYRANLHPIDLFRTKHLGIAGQYSEKFTAYRRVIYVEFAPLGYDKIAVGFLYSFLKGASRTITIDAVSYGVTIDGNSLQFDFQEGTFFGDSFAIVFKVSDMLSITDTLSTRILKPSYTTSSEGISGETLRMYVNLCDDIAIEVVKHDLDFINGDKEDVAHAYSHIITIDTGAIYKSSVRNWLYAFVQWQHKQIDTTLVDPDNGKVYDVIFDGNGIDWQLSENVKDVTSAVLVFKETTPRTVAETFIPISNVYDEVIFDEVVAQ